MIVGNSVAKKTFKNKVIIIIQKFLRFIDIFHKIEQKLFDYWELEEIK